MEIKFHASSSQKMSPAMREYVTTSVNKHLTNLPKDAIVKCTYTNSNLDKIVELRIVSKEYTVQKEVVSKDFYRAVDESLDELKYLSNKRHKKAISKRKYANGLVNNIEELNGLKNNNENSPEEMEEFIEDDE